MCGPGVQVQRQPVGIVEDQQPADGRLDDGRMLDAHAVQVLDPALQVVSALHREADRVKSAAALGRGRVDAKRHHGRQQAGDLAGEPADHPVGLGELDRGAQPEHLPVPAQ